MPRVVVGWSAKALLNEACAQLAGWRALMLAVVVALAGSQRGGGPVVAGAVAGPAGGVRAGCLGPQGRPGGPGAGPASWAGVAVAMSVTGWWGGG
jgi:hypothetical protein